MSCDEPEIIRSLSLFILHAFKRRHDYLYGNIVEKNDHCISHTVIMILLLNVLKGPLAYQIKTTTTATTSQLFPISLNIYVMGLRPL